MPTHPEVLWAQRSSESEPEKNIVYLTVNLPEINEKSLEYNLTPTSLHFKAKAGNETAATEVREYAFDLDLYGEVEPEQSHKALTTRAFKLVLRKKEHKAEYWPRLTKEKLKVPFIKTDFNRWVDEDEQDGEVKLDDDFDAGGPGGAFGGPGGGFGGGAPGGMPGMPGGMDFEKMMAEMNASGAGGGASGIDLPDEDSSGDEEDDGPPPLDDTEPKDAAPKDAEPKDAEPKAGSSSS